jgi:hypothetical protein
MAEATLVKDGRGPRSSISVYTWSGDTKGVTINPGFEPSAVEVIRQDPGGTASMRVLMAGGIESVLVGTTGAHTVGVAVNVTVSATAEPTVTMLAATLSATGNNYVAILYR